MAAGIGTVEVKKVHGKMVVNGLGQTPRGQKFIRNAVVLEVADPADPKFKGELSTAVTQLLG